MGKLRNPMQIFSTVVILSVASALELNAEAEGRKGRYSPNYYGKGYYGNGYYGNGYYGSHYYGYGNNEFYGKPAPKQPKIEDHSCKDGKYFKCEAGSDGCYDNSPEYCDQCYPGGCEETHTCKDGKEFTCNDYSERQICYDDSPAFCPCLFGCPERHQCADGEYYYCNGGTLGCFGPRHRRHLRCLEQPGGDRACRKTLERC